MGNIRVPFVVPHIAKLAASVLAFGVALTVGAAEYDCTVKKKVDRDREYSTEQISRSQFANRIEEVGEQAWVSRCSFTPSAGKVTCDRLKMDRVLIDPKVKIKKFYMFSAQFDLQLYPDLTYVENNGRGGISYGNCTLVAP